MTFPYLDISQKSVDSFADVVYNFSRIENICNSPTKRTAEACTVALRFLQQSENLDFSSISFCEAVAYGAEACCYASAFGFREVYSIEYSDAGRKLAYKRLTRVGPGAQRLVRLQLGRYQENFVIDAGITYFDTNLYDDLDEGVVLEAFLRLCKLLLPGSYIVIVTQIGITEFRLGDWGVDYMELVLPTTVSKVENDESSLLVYKIIAI